MNHEHEHMGISWMEHRLPIFLEKIHGNLPQVALRKSPEMMEIGWNWIGAYPLVN
jgi:hypothetical protein